VPSLLSVAFFGRVKNRRVAETKMIFTPVFMQRLPATHTLLETANLVVHPNVSRIVLHGSRGLAGGARPDSDVDLSLIVDLPAASRALEQESFLHSVFATTFNAWQSDVEVDLAVVFETRACALYCFTQITWRDDLCSRGGLDCFGLYKVQKGFSGLVTNAGIQVKRMVPCLEIWRRSPAR
jgi:predicted nucleotidyltransferase